MDSKLPNMDSWMDDTLNSWAEQGTFSSERSNQLHEIVTNLAHQERKNRLTRKICELVVAIITSLWLLFASCPVAAASNVSDPMHLNHSLQINVIGLLAIFICFFLKNQIQSQTNNRNLEVHYE